MTVTPDCAVRIWPLGDSLTVGGYGDRAGFTDSYRYELFRQLTTSGKNVVFRGHIGAPGSVLQWGAVPPAGTTGEFSHSGVGGYSVADMVRDLTTFATGLRPDVIVVNLGTNGGKPGEYRQLIARLQQLAPNAYIVMGTLTPRVPELGSRRVVDAERSLLNATIRAIGSESSSDRLFTAEVTERLFNDDPMTTADFFDDTHLAVSGGTKFGRALTPEVSLAAALAKRC